MIGFRSQAEPRLGPPKDRRSGAPLIGSCLCGGLIGFRLCEGRQARASKSAALEIKVFRRLPAARDAGRAQNVR
jgi:hypothetical protein